MPAALIGLALAATSIGITSRVLAEMGMLDRAFARVILGAAIVDDILALLAIGVLSGLAEGDLGIDTVLTLVAGLAFVGIGLALAPLGRRLPRKLFVWPKFADTPVVPVFIIMFAGALLAQFVGLAAIIGAFVVGLIIAETPVREEVEHGFRPLLGIFAPFFFAVTGANIDMSALLAAGPARHRPGARGHGRPDQAGRRRHRLVEAGQVELDRGRRGHEPARRGRHRRLARWVSRWPSSARRSTRSCWPPSS